MLGTKMVREGFGVAGGDIDIGAANHVRAACSKKFAADFGPFFSNDTGRFSSPHPATLDLPPPENRLRYRGGAGPKGPYRID